MTLYFNKQEEIIISALQDDMEICERPFQDIADKTGLKEQEIIDFIKRYKKDGRIRRFGATLRHRISGYEANAMVAWLVPEKDIDTIGTLFSKKRFVTHCYVRLTSEDWPYNLYTMIHAKNRDKCGELTLQLSKESGINDYQILFSDKELKKISMRYVKETKESASEK